MTSDLFAAITAGDRQRASALVAAQPRLATTPDASGLSPLLQALYHGQAEIAADLLRAAPPEALSVHDAAAAGLTDRLEQILARDPAAVNAWGADGFPPLALAAFFGQRSAVELLLRHGAEVSAHARHPFQVTALHAALAGPQPDLARLLVDAGADVNARQQGGFTPLHTTAQNSQLELTRLLLDRGADARAQNDQGQTPADLARAAGHTAVAELLDAAH